MFSPNWVQILLARHIAVRHVWTTINTRNIRPSITCTLNREKHCKPLLILHVPPPNAGLTSIKLGDFISCVDVVVFLFSLVHFNGNFA
jgi:hypothetical protein